MPNNIMMADVNFPDLSGKSQKEQISTITNYLFMLLEQLRYVLNNLGISNFNESELDGMQKQFTGPIQIQVTDMEGNISTLFADVNQIVPDASSTSELIYDLLEKERITKEIAEALYLGIVHDTGVFQYSCTKPSTMEAAAELLRKGIDGPKIIEKTFYEKTYAQNQVLGKALLESICLMDGKVIFSYITKKSMNFFGVKAKDLEGIVSQLRVTTGVEVAIFLYELESGEFKVSLRSKEKVDVSKVAQYFGGGGHVRAAGLTFRGTVHDAVNNIVGQVALQLEEEA